MLSLTLLLSTLSALIFAVATIRRVYRLARYFQLEGYESNRYLRWFGRTRPETRYALATFAGLLLLLIPIPGDFALYAPLTNPADDASVGLIQSILSIIVALALLLIAPRDKQVKQPFNPTPRARRLLAVAFVVSVSLPVYYAALLVINAARDVVTNPASAAVFSGTAGAIALLLAPLMLPLANILLWPYEESQRRYFMRRAKANLKRSGATVICITGSYGKTSTKHYLQHILSARYRTLMTPKSFNTLMGISRAINDILAGDASYEYFIVEADAYFVGENASICRLVEPQIGLVMTVGPMRSSPRSRPMESEFSTATIPRCAP
jgi:UDP-N-acetylmuramoyl-tripeptide--D-alanyl-D-alanine ligase